MWHRRAKTDHRRQAGRHVSTRRLVRLICSTNACSRIRPSTSRYSIILVTPVVIWNSARPVDRLPTPTGVDERNEACDESIRPRCRSTTRRDDVQDRRGSSSIDRRRLDSGRAGPRTMDAAGVRLRRCLSARDDGVMRRRFAFMYAVRRCLNSH